MNIGTPKGFLTVGGVILVLLALAGFTFLGPTEEASAAGSFFWLDNGENWAHLLLGVIGLLVAFVMPANGSFQKWLVALLGVVGLLVTVAGFVSNNFLGANLEMPSDNILHLVVGVWALWASFGKSK